MGLTQRMQSDSRREDVGGYRLWLITQCANFKGWYTLPDAAVEILGVALRLFESPRLAEALEFPT